MNLENLVDEYLKVCENQNNLNYKTVKSYKLDLKQYMVFLDKEENYYRKEILCKYIEMLHTKDYRVKTIKRKIATLKAFFSYLVCEDILEYNPFVKIRLRLKEPVILPKTIPIVYLENLFKCLYDERDNADKNTYKYKALSRDIIILEILISTGIRIIELCDLRKEQISYSERTIRIYGKGDKERILPVYNENLWKEIKQYEELFGLEIKGYFFINRINNKLSDQSVRNMIKKNCKKASIPINITPHMFRHTFATLLLENDVDSRNIQQILGHSSITTTQIYTNITSNKKIEIMKYKNPRLKISTNKG